LAILGLWALNVAAAPPERMGKADEDPPPVPKQPKADPPKPKKEPLKTFQFEKRDQRWKDVIEWLCDKAELPLIGVNMPTGTFTYIGGGKKGHTIPEIIDIINEGLLTNRDTQKFILIRRERSFTLVPADDPIDPALLPRLTPDELDDRGKTELVSVALTLKSLVAEDVAAGIRQMMGPFGKVAVIAEANQVVMQDTVGNLKRIIKTFQDLDKEGTQKAETFIHDCKYIKAREAKKTLESALGDPREVARIVAAATAPRGGGGGRGGINFQDLMGGGRGGGNQPAAAPNIKVRMHYVTADETNNKVIVTGPANKVAQARAIMEDIDTDKGGRRKVAKGEPYLASYSVPSGNAESLAKTLTSVYRDSPSTTITPAGPAKIIVWAMPDDHIDIKKHIEGEKDDNKADLIRLNVLDAEKLAETLRNCFPGDAKVGGPFIEADTLNNAIRVRGTTAQVAEVKSAIEAFGEGKIGEGGGGIGQDLGPNTRVITIDKGSAALIAETLQRLFKDLKKNPVNVVTPRGVDENGGKKPEPLKEKPREDDKPKDKDKASGAASGPVKRTVLIARADDPLDDPQADKQPKKDGKQGAPVNIIAIGNRLIIKSDDPQALALAQQMVRLLLESSKSGAGMEVIPLKNADAREAAKVLDEAFNGPKDNTQQQNPFARGGFFARFGGFGAQAPTPKPDSIRVVADPGSNSLIIVKASPIDMLQIRSLLEKAIDKGSSELTGLPETHVIKLKFANATDVSNVIKDVYREKMNNNPAPGQVGGFRGFRFGGFRGFGNQNANIGPDGQPRAVTLSVGVDEKTNSLIVNCPKALYEDITKLCGQLELSAKENKRTVRVVSLGGSGLDPAVVQQAVDAVLGRTSSSSTTNSFQGFPGGGIFRGGGGGGFGGGGGRGGGGFGGGGMRRGGGGQAPDDGQGQGPRFFVDRVKDDPELSPLYDPQQERLTAAEAKSSQSNSPGQREAPLPLPDDNLGGSAPPITNVPGSAPPSTNAPNSAIRQTRYEEAELQQPPPVMPPAEGTVEGPRLPVTVEGIPELDAVIINAQNPQDAEAILQVIELLKEMAKTSEIQVEMVRLREADATSVVNMLNQLYSRVVVTASGQVRLTAPTITQNQLGFLGTQQTTTAQAPTVALLAVPRFNAIFVAAPKARIKEVLDKIRLLDHPPSLESHANTFHLERASAQRVGQLIQNFWAVRYPGETSGQHQIRVTWDTSANNVFVQAAPGDLSEIRALIEHLDKDESKAINLLKVVHLGYALSDNVALLLVQAISQGVATPTVPPATVPGAGAAGGVGGAVPGGGFVGAPGFAGGAPGGAGGGGAGGFAGGGGAGGLIGGAGAVGAAGGAVGRAIGTTTTGTRTSSIRFVSTRNGGHVYESGLLEEVYIFSDTNTNSLIVLASEKTMELVEALIKELDVLPTVIADVKVFQLRRADATNSATMLQQLLFGTTTGTTGLGGRGGLPGGPTTPTTGGVPGAPGAIAGTTGTGGAAGLHISVDQRTNSIIAAGNPDDLFAIYAILTKLDDADIPMRIDKVYQLHNAFAADVATPLATFLSNDLTVRSSSGELTAWQQGQQQIVIVPEPITNKLLISVTPPYYDRVMKLIEQLDAESPQVMIQCLLATVQLDASEEFGCEVGLQSPVLFQRSILPQFGQGGTVSYANATGGLVQPGVSVTGTSNPTAQPGFLFNSTGPLGQNPVAGPGVVGIQGITNLGLGRLSPSGSNIGGFVFSMSSDTFSLLIRALKTQGRLEILSRPQVMTLDNQSATVLVGQNFPIVTGSVAAGTTGAVTNTISYVNVGVELDVTPKISPDGKVLMRVQPIVSSVVPTPVSIGVNTTATAFNTETVSTTIIAGDGETVAIGGLIATSDTKTENKVPWLGDLPYIGTAFRTRFHTKQKKELLVILTPHICRSRLDLDRILAEESRRMDWIVSGVMCAHATTGMEPVLESSRQGGAGCLPGVSSTPQLPGAVPSEHPGADAPSPRVLPEQPIPVPQGQLPPATEGRVQPTAQPTTLPNVATPASQPAAPPTPPPAIQQVTPPNAAAPAVEATAPPYATPPAVQQLTPPYTAPPVVPPTSPSSYAPPAPDAGSAPIQQGKERGGWSLFRRN
jgi:type II secretion system protein D